jgi:hypothetical protein
MGQKLSVEVFEPPPQFSREPATRTAVKTLKRIPG